MRKKVVLKKELVLFTICILFYLFCYIVDGFKVEPDTYSYVSGAYSREPLYPVFLMFFRSIFGETYFFSAVVLFQCIFTAVATWYFTIVVDKRFQLGVFSDCIIVALQFAVVMFCRLVAQRKSTYCNAICTEGLAIPLFTLFLTEIVLFAWNKKNKNVILSMLWAICLINVRKQMYIVVIIMLVSYTGMFLLRQIRWQKWLVTILSVISAVICAVGIDLLYNLVLRGEAMRHTNDSSAMVITSLYCSDVEDSVCFEDEQIRGLFLDIMIQVENEEYNYEHAEKGWLELFNHYSNHYDLIAFEIVNPGFYNYLDKHFELSSNETELAFDELNYEMLKVLLPRNWKKIIKVAECNMLAGFSNTVSKASKKMNWYNILFYTMYICFLVRSIVKKQNKGLTSMAAIILLSTIANVCVVGVMIFAQSRYMIYNMPLIYVVMYLWLLSYFNEWKKKRGEKSA